ncbi:MAG: hypothetical protein ACK5PZ_15495 [Pirellula sp.]
MQLDTTSIVIAQRSIDELLDLSLVVARTYLPKIILFSILGIVPFFVINLVLLYPITDYDRLSMASTYSATNSGYQARYWWTQVCLVYLQAPLAMCGVTYFLGQAVFIEQPTIRQVFGVLTSRAMALTWVLGFLRGGLLAIAFACIIFVSPYTNTHVEQTVYLTLFTILVFLVRGFRPFAPEILLLERCPLFIRKKSNANDLSYGRRTAWLHAGSGDLFSVQIVNTIISVAFVLLACLGILYVSGIVFGIRNWGFWMDLILFPSTLWVMAKWSAIIRFLLYLNTRIRTEGWEVELKLKAEQQRLMANARLMEGAS